MSNFSQNNCEINIFPCSWTSININISTINNTLWSFCFDSMIDYSKQYVFHSFKYDVILFKYFLAQGVIKKSPQFWKRFCWEHGEVSKKARQSLSSKCFLWWWSRWKITTMQKKLVENSDRNKKINRKSEIIGWEPCFSS